MKYPYVAADCLLALVNGGDALEPDAPWAGALLVADFMIRVRSALGGK